MDAIKYSEKAYLQLINVLFKPIANGNWVTTAFRWMINSKFRQYKRLDKFQKDQLTTMPAEIITLADSFKEYKYNKRIVEILKYVHKLIRYKHDEGEVWSTAIETLLRGSDDCDGINNLIWVLARYSGIPSFKLYCVIGNTSAGYHYYLVYMARGQLYAIDGTYWPNMQPIHLRPKFKLTPSKYTSVDYVFNDDHIFKIK